MDDEKSTYMWSSLLLTVEEARNQRKHNVSYFHKSFRLKSVRVNILQMFLFATKTSVQIFLRSSL